MKQILYKGFKIQEGKPQYTHYNYSIYTGNTNSPNHHYYGGAWTVKEAKEIINKNPERIY